MSDVNVNYYEFLDMKIEVGKMYRHKHIDDYCAVTKITKRQIKKSTYHDVTYYAFGSGKECSLLLQSFPKYYKEYNGDNYAYPSSISSNSH